MIYYLQEDNPLYGKQGFVISMSFYGNLPEKHKKLFSMNNPIKKKPNDDLKTASIHRTRLSYQEMVDNFERLGFINAVDVQNNDVAEINEEEHEDGDYDWRVEEDEEE